MPRYGGRDRGREGLRGGKMCKRGWREAPSPLSLPPSNSPPNSPPTNPRKFPRAKRPPRRRSACRAVLCCAVLPAGTLHTEVRGILEPASNARTNKERRAFSIREKKPITNHQSKQQPKQTLTVVSKACPSGSNSSCGIALRSSATSSCGSLGIFLGRRRWVSREAFMRPLGSNW